MKHMRSAMRGAHAVHVFSTCADHIFFPPVLFSARYHHPPPPSPGIYCGVWANARIMKELGPPLIKPICWMVDVQHRDLMSERPYRIFFFLLLWPTPGRGCGQLQPPLPRR
mmetsp:Transcript_72311/g.121364  ORF Transcript_72311/g.121364 Transcript_72311/m.121364 type:complete len:111 (-) Transcript_72311:293-625(-)